MKIYSFPGIYDRNHDTPIQHYERGTGALKRDHHDADSVEISTEARKRYDASRVIELKRERTRKIAHEYEPVVRQAITEEGGDISRRRERIAHLQQTYGADNTVFSDEALRAVAELIV